MENIPSETQRDYDIVLYGATGFVGRQAVRYLAQHVPADAVRWAIAGRDRYKLEVLREAAGVNADVIVADSAHQADVDGMAARTRVLINTVGPFALYGTPVVDACVRLKTHYVDIAGETAWIRRLIDHYHETAAANGTRIIPSCGFDSVPSDLGSFLVARRMQKERGVPCRQIRAYFQMAGGFNGGTIASGLNQYESSDADLLRDPFLLNPQREQTKTKIEQNRDVAHAMYDVDMRTWVGPFIMAPINTRVVRRSAALLEQWNEGYGPDFSYQEYLKYDPPFPMLKAQAVTGAAGLIGTAMANAKARDVLKRILPKPGQGPSERTMETGWFVCELLGIGTDGHRVRCVMRHQGDPGNKATARFVCESALAIALEENNLPGGRERGGLLTPASGLGDVLAERLRRSGMAIEITA